MPKIDRDALLVCRMRDHPFKAFNKFMKEGVSEVNDALTLTWVISPLDALFIENPAMREVPSPASRIGSPCISRVPESLGFDEGDCTSVIWILLKVFTFCHCGKRLI
ncbi:hypothetical protein NDY24_16000 [Xanthomonas hortorum pv. pelargonii]|nr:hypothetical protein NDY24_16000 [Xanthomonas hortorum pv. pelargonii]